MGRSDWLGLVGCMLPRPLRLTDFTANGTCTFRSAGPVSKAATPTDLPVSIRFDATEISWQAVEIVNDAEDETASCFSLPTHRASLRRTGRRG